MEFNKRHKEEKIMSAEKDKVKIFREVCISCKKPLMDFYPVVNEPDNFVAICNHINCPFSDKVYMAKITKDDVESFEAQVRK